MSLFSALIIQQKLEAIDISPLVFSLFSIIIFVFLKWFFTSHVKKNLPPSPRGIPILGHLLQLGLLAHHPIHSLAKKHGPIMLLRFGKVPTVIVSSPEGAKEIMKNQDLIFADRPKTSVAERLLYNMKDISVSPYGEYWRHLKSISVLHLLSNKKVQEFHHVGEEEIALMVKNIQECADVSSPVNLSEMFLALTNDVVCRSALGRKHGEGSEGKKVRKLLSEFVFLLGSTFLGRFIYGLEWVNKVNGFDAQIERVSKGIDEFLEKVIEERLEKGLDVNDEDFLNILLRIYKDTESGESLERDSLKAIILDMFAAGSDPTAVVAEWVMTELFRHPSVMKKAQNEVREVLVGKQEINDSDLEKMPYLKAIFKETLRLHPPIPMLLPREARQDTEVMGYHVVAGTMVMINTWTIGGDPTLWDVPEEFQPERFLNSSIDYKGHDFEFTPFGAGRRGCPAIPFAMATNELALANILHKFKWSLPNSAKGEDLDIEERPGISIGRKNQLLAVAVSVDV